MGALRKAVLASVCPRTFLCLAPKGREPLRVPDKRGWLVTLRKASNLAKFSGGGGPGFLAWVAESGRAKRGQGRWQVEGQSEGGGADSGQRRLPEQRISTVCEGPRGGSNVTGAPGIGYWNGSGDRGVLGWPRPESRGPRRAFGGRVSRLEQSPRLGGLPNRNLSSPSSGGPKSEETEVRAGPDPSEGCGCWQSWASLGLQMQHPRLRPHFHMGSSPCVCWYVCESLFKFPLFISHDGFRPNRMT